MIFIKSYWFKIWDVSFKNGVFDALSLALCLWNNFLSVYTMFFYPNIDMEKLYFISIYSINRIQDVVENKEYNLKLRPLFFIN